MANAPPALRFKVSSGLKSVLGRELITDDQVAIFELVKNSFDAGAKTVRITFDSDTITIVDDGSGMSRLDIEERWLVVAFSKKKGVSANYRDEVAERRHYAGSKGIGRFSSDRLGRFVELQTRPQSASKGKVHKVIIDWDKFDRDPEKAFSTIAVTYSEQSKFDMPPPAAQLAAGTIVTISELRTEWDHPALLRLKAGLAKLINPFGSTQDHFRVFISAPAEEISDKKERDRALKKGEAVIPSRIVNGEIQNFVFKDLRAKTTAIQVELDQSGEHIISTLIDRGELIYKIREKNPFKLIARSQFRCDLFFTNTAAKLTFTKRVGIPAVRFGSVFLFRNGFRVFPIGEPGDDWLGIDLRHQQGFRRFLSSRNIIGRIDVAGDDTAFQEASSRNQGLVVTPAVTELKKCFSEYCLERLENYVIPVTWPDKTDRQSEDISRLLTDPGKARVTQAVADLVTSENVELVKYSKKLVALLDEDSDEFLKSVGGLKAIALGTGNRQLTKSIEVAERKYSEIKLAEENARKVADEQRAAAEAAIARAESAEEKVTETSEQLEQEKKRNLFLVSLSTKDNEALLSMHHQIIQYSDALRSRLDNLIIDMGAKEALPEGHVVDELERLALLNKRIFTVSKMATQAGFILESERIEADLGEYIAEYVETIVRDFVPAGLQVNVSNDGKGKLRQFKPIDVSIVVDNLISNSRKAEASQVDIAITHPQAGVLEILVSDDGSGINSKIVDPARIFEKGVTTTHGSGLGLFHVREVLNSMGATIALKSSKKGETSFLIRMPG